MSRKLQRNSMFEVIMNLTSPKNDVCLLCKRNEIYTDKHHLIPRTMHQRIKKQRDKKPLLFERIHETVNLCRACHSKIHQEFSEKELAFKYNTLDIILEQKIIKDWIEWIKNKPCNFSSKEKKKRK